MSKLIVAMENQLLVVNDVDGTPHIELKLQNTRPQALAVDPFRSGRIYAATFGEGLWVTKNSGTDWMRIGGDALLREVILSQSAPESKMGDME
jgi:hypothetical protein